MGIKSKIFCRDYIVYENGIIFNTRTNKHVKQYATPDGYFKVMIRLGYKKRKGFFVHRILAYLFLKNPKNKKEVNHIDGDKKNNQLDNLEWCTHSENIQHAWKTELIKNTLTRSEKIKKANIGRNGKLNSTSKPVICIETGERFESIRLAGKHYNICPSGISRVCTGDQKTAGKCKIKNINLTWRIDEKTT